MALHESSNRTAIPIQAGDPQIFALEKRKTGKVLQTRAISETMGTSTNLKTYSGFQASVEFCFKPRRISPTNPTWRP